MNDRIATLRAAAFILFILALALFYGADAIADHLARKLVEALAMSIMYLAGIISGHPGV